MNGSFAQAEERRFKMKVGVSLVILEQDKILLIRRCNTGVGDGMHVLPMGGVEATETALDAAVREALEEVNVSIKPHCLELVHTMCRWHHLPDGNSFKQIDLFFRPTTYSGEIRNMEPHKCDEVKFYPLNALPETLAPFLQQALTYIDRKIAYSEHGWK